MSHLDVTPNVLPQLLDIMKPLSEGSAKDAGMQTYQILRQAPGTGNHFRLFEIWASERAFDAHNLAAHTQSFRNDLAPMLGTPYDQRKYVPVN
jgi:quinol monooxygenase YgiN